MASSSSGCAWDGCSNSLLTALLFLPIFYRLGLTSTYEVLGGRPEGLRTCLTGNAGTRQEALGSRTVVRGPQAGSPLL